ncbi:excisionase family DNA-binding protein [Paraburkholderia strydomiana]|uniref:GAF domain-containing protein n=1 Tax=Paraburkholderia strydomiana TaxID=1245417 RepID=UPI0038BA47DF
MEDPIITTRAAAELLGVSIRTAQTWIEENALDSWKTPGGHRRVRRSAVMDLMARLARERIQGPALVLVHAPQHKLQRYVDTLSLSPECTVHAEADTFRTLLTAGYLLPMIVVLELDGGDSDGQRIVQQILSHPGLGHTSIVVTGDATGEDLIMLGASRSRVHILPASWTAEALQSKVRQLLSDKGALARTATGPVSGEPATNESQRLLAVAAAGVVDTPEEEAFDEITRLAATILEVPIALLTLLTPDRQWFKSHWGLDRQETPRSWAFCNFTILQDDVFVVEDATADRRFAENPLVTGEPHIRFYAGVNIRDIQGYALGSLCVIDRAPRRLPHSHRDALATLGRLASDRINLRIRERQLRWAVAASANTNPAGSA